MDAVQEILKRNKAQQQQQAQQAQQQQQQAAQQTAPIQHWEQHDVPRQPAHAPVQQPTPQPFTPQQYEPEEINPMFRPPQTNVAPQANSGAWVAQSQQSNLRSLSTTSLNAQGAPAQQQHSHNAQPVQQQQQLAAQPPSPPELTDPFIRQGHNQRRSSKPLQRASLSQQQGTAQPPQQHMVMSPVANTVPPTTTYYAPNEMPPQYSTRDSQQHHHHPQQQSPMPQHHAQQQPPPIPPQQQAPQQQHQNRAQLERADPAFPQGRVNSPSQPHFTPQQASYARRASYGGVTPNEPAYPMQLPRHRNIPLQPPPAMDRESVTIFMEDFRVPNDGEPEHLLAEVVIPLRTSATHDGYWANAQELVEQLQLGPSRIDGPAKVFCRRGKYKHCFMRMSDANDVECQPSSLQISPELSIQITIEANNAPHNSQYRSAPYHVPARKSPRRSIPHDGSPLAQPVPSREVMPIEVFPHSTQHHHSNPTAAVSSPQLRAAVRVMSPVDPSHRRDSMPLSPPLRKRSLTDRGPDSPGGMTVDIDERPTKRPSITSLSQTASGFAQGQQQQGGSAGSAQTGYYNSKGGAPSQYGGPRPSTSGGLPPQPGAPPPASSAAGRAPPEALPSPPAASSDSGTRERTPTQSLSNPNSHSNLRDNGTTKEPASPTIRNSFDDGQWRAPRAQVNTAIANWLKPHIQREEGYSEFMHSKGHVLSIPQLLRVYGFAQRQIAKWNNQRTPENAEGCPLKKIGKSNVLQALGRQTSWGSDCEQTLAFVEKYGPGGSRETERVVALVNGKVMPGEKEGSVYFLQVLREVDKEWRTANVSATGNGSNDGVNDGADGDELSRKGSVDASVLPQHPHPPPPPPSQQQNIG